MPNMVAGVADAKCQSVTVSKIGISYLSGQPLAGFFFLSHPADCG